MLQTFLIALLALAVRDIFYEVINWFQHYRWHRRAKRKVHDHQVFQSFLEDLDADDDY